ncbi:MAG TPA: ribosomal RNA small subunit methyltransferase A, partial [Firmicutes bacterium]|nr:ribosomal RNA small subunit methyltransferase A [Bacillota bacterium]
MSKFHFKKKYGQNFLRDEITLEKIASSIVPTNKDLIIEIGPGSGALTKKIKRYGAKIIAFEIDEETKRYLLPIEDEDTKIIYGNFLEIDIVKTIKHISYEKLYIIGNLPYYITTPILEHIIESQVDPHEIVIMVQKEVGERFLASPKTKAYGYMTVLLSYNYTVEKILDVKSTAFYPIPKVDSMVLKLKRKNRENIDYLKFQKLL